MDRKKFLQLAVLSNLGLLLPSQKVAATTINALSFTQTFNTGNVTYFKKGEEGYEKLRKGFNKRINKYPQVIALCYNTDGVAEAMQYAIKNQLPVAIKSGGHCMEGFSCNNDGMVINLSLLNDVKWVSKSIIKVGPACILSALYNAILPKGKILPGGSCGSVGIGGLSLGGGYGLLSRQYGLACDSLLEVTMVDGKGNIINSAVDDDLLWACKGGGNGNFGAITEMKFKVHKAPALMKSFRFRAFKVNTGRAKDILKKWFELSDNLPPTSFSAYVLNGKTLYILLTSTEKNIAGIKFFIDGISALVDKTVVGKALPIATALKAYYGIQHPVYFKNASAGLYKKFEDIESYIADVMDIVTNTPGMIYQVNTLGGNIINNQFEKASAFPHRSYPYFSELQTYWDNEKQMPGLLNKFKDVQDIFIKNGINVQYRNYPDINFNNYNTLYYGNSYTKLQQIKNKYDPDNIISHEQSIKNA
ncbi:MAG: FAD-binding oxidoreductase [Chitinophagaceae bacterium]|nr:FAD-binding oxidoreductase [Chitinophagaceae bacterium]